MLIVMHKLKCHVYILYKFPQLFLVSVEQMGDSFHSFRCTAIMDIVHGIKIFANMIGFHDFSKVCVQST